MKAIRYPAPLQPGDLIGVTAPSSGVPDVLSARLAVAVKAVEDRGFEVVLGDCLTGAGHVSAPAADRAAELSGMLTEPAIRAVVPPWGGETAIDLLPLLDFAAIAAAEPTWLVGYSDISTLITPLTLLTGVATVHGNNLMDTPYRAPEGLLTWLDIVTAGPGDLLVQDSPGRYREGFVDYRDHPGASEFALDVPGRWTRLDAAGDLDVAGRLIGGCVETIRHLAGTRFGDTTAFSREYAPEGLLVYLEADADDAFQICRSLHGMRLAGFFDAANAILIGRTKAPGRRTMSQHEAVLDALGGLGVPIIADVECGHVAPYLPLVNGALVRVVHSRDADRIEQVLL
jgi:muramoyltetrapeptide carboxypeptidase LdcA involved in peptidoglycan recycling